MTDRPAPNVPNSPNPTSIPPPSITNPLPQQAASAPPAQTQVTPTSAAATATATVTTTSLPAAATTVTHVSTPAASITITDTVSQQPATAKEAIKVSNVPSVFVPPAFTNRPADYREEDEESARPPRNRTRLTGTRSVLVPHMYDTSRPSLPLDVQEDDWQWELRPSYLTQQQQQADPANGAASDGGSGSTRPSLVYLNAQRVAYYNQLLPSPRYLVWVLIKNTSFLLNTTNNVGYVKRRLVETALRRNIQVLLMNPYHFDLAVSASGSSSIIYRGAAVQLPDCVIPRVGANVDYFGLAVLRQLEALGVLVFNPVNAIEISRDKLYTHQVLSAHGIPIPQTVLSRFPFEYDYIEQHFQYPLIVKLASGSRGEAVWKLDSRAELSALLERVDKTRPMIVQEFLSSTQGRDIRCLVVGDEVVASCMRISSTSFLANYHAGGSTVGVAVSDGLRRMVVAASRRCGLSFSGVDVLLADDGYRLCEVNSSPGFEGLERATGVDCAAAMLDYAVQQIEAGRRDKRPGPGTGGADGGWRVREKEYPLQDDHMRIILEAKEKDRQAEEERAEAAAATAEAAKVTQSNATTAG